MKVAFCVSEVFPFAKTGGLADVGGSLPLALSKIGVDVKVFMPFYKCVRKLDIKIEYENDLFATVRMGNNVSLYLVKNKEYFDRDGLYVGESSDYEDNLLRFKYFCLAILEILKIRGFKPDIIHCHDWQAALLPVYLKEKYREDDFFKDTKTVLTIHNLAYQGVFPTEKFSQLDLDSRLYHIDGFEFYDQINLLKSGIINAGALNTVSPQYAQEIQTKEFGCGLDGVLRDRTKGVKGILNGLDYSIWDPANDKWLGCNYDARSFEEGKLKNKQALFSMLGQSYENQIVLGFVGRLSHQKGIDLIIDSMDELMSRDTVLVIQGVGDLNYESRLKRLAEVYPNRIFIQRTFDEKLAHTIYAASDIFLMPSSFEPCGLSQLIALKYGSIPAVFHTGGLVDTIREFSAGQGNGFVFVKYGIKDFVAAVDRAISVLSDPFSRKEIITNAMNCEFSWERSAEKYLELYTCLL